ncbi:MAG: AraC family transcriptional regulator [Gemmatimonadaceae bacterium]|nr:AraC family transcriptional regulator [Gemmatimonadaceae bacterium]
MTHGRAEQAGSERMRRALLASVDVGYRETPPPPEAAALIECCWTSRSEGPQRVAVHPDGCVDVIIRAPRRRTHSGPRSGIDVVGIMTRSQFVTVNADDVFAGIRFRPGIASSVLGRAVSVLSDRSASLATFAPDVETRVMSQAADATVDDIFAAVIATLVPRIQEAPDAAQRAINALVTSNGQRSLTDCHDIAHMSERSFRRHCVERVGLPPKQLAGLLRFRHVRDRLHAAGGTSMATIALACGYSAQSHMIREVRRITGLTPTRLHDGYTVADLFKTPHGQTHHL